MKRITEYSPGAFTLTSISKFFVIYWCTYSTPYKVDYRQLTSQFTLYVRDTSYSLLIESECEFALLELETFFSGIASYFMENFIITKTCVETDMNARTELLQNSLANNKRNNFLWSSNAIQNRKYLHFSWASNSSLYIVSARVFSFTIRVSLRWTDMEPRSFDRCEKNIHKHRYNIRRMKYLSSKNTGIIINNKDYRKHHSINNVAILKKIVRSVSHKNVASCFWWF